MGAGYGERAWEVAVMAVYAFRCKKCKRKFAVTCHIEERDAKAVCPKRGSRQVEQRYTAEFSSPRPAKY